MRIGSVLALSLRLARTPSPGRVDRALALAGHGLDGDIHADPRSPRQLLLADATTYADLALPAHALGENLLIDLDTATLASGTVLQVGLEAQLRLMFSCEACGQLDRTRPGLANSIGKRRGMLARVERGGPIARGDAIVSLGMVKPAWPDDWRERVRRVIEAVPAGQVVEYGQLARLAGIQPTYCRAFTRLLARLGPRYQDQALAARAPDPRPRWDGAGLFDSA